MQPLVLTNAFLRPSATFLPEGARLSEGEKVYACVEEMVTVIREELGATPLMLPASFDAETVKNLLRHVDGIFLPGAVSNMHPSLYSEAENGMPQVFDRAHDAVDLFLVRQAREMGIPFLGICRSMQAMNLAFGGTLQQKLQPGSVDHACSDPCDGHDDAPAFMHEAMLEQGGYLSLHFPTGRIAINSMHQQGVGKVGDGLRVEARAPDGVVEAISWPAAPAMFLGVQWHPEAMPKNPVSQKLFELFRADIGKRFAARSK